ncbi:MAG: Adaptive-response sensory-kinase SasA [Anaerolineales bacterium]|nr:Adaptive-response sensory-kinase SasA [Anaerolineales bacterium]
MPEIETQRLDGYRRLIEIARDLASTLDLDELLRRIVFAAAEITDAMAGSILLYDSTSRQLFFQVSTNMDQSTMRGLVVPLEGSIAGWIVTNRKPVRINNPHDDPRFFPQIEQSTGFSNRSMLGVPLITKEKVVGVLEVLNKNNGDFFDGDENLLRVLGAQAAVAIENARLFQQSDLIAEFVHELRTPLASLSTAAYLLLRPEISQEQREQIVTSIHNETLRLSAMTSTFLDLARLESGRVQFHKTSFNLGDLLHECRNVMQGKADEMHIQIRVELAEHLPSMDADRDKIKQVLLNLISNAIKYNRPNGTVILRADSSADEIFAAVQDTGLGIPEEALPHLFEKFYRVREHEGVAAGTGLGLSICKQIVQGHNGTLEVKSKFGAGTAFILKLPRNSKATPR